MGNVLFVKTQAPAPWILFIISQERGREHCHPLSFFSHPILPSFKHGTNVL